MAALSYLPNMTALSISISQGCKRATPRAGTKRTNDFMVLARGTGPVMKIRYLAALTFCSNILLQIPRNEAEQVPE